MILDPRKIFVITIALFTGVIHFLVGPEYNGPFPLFVNGYLIDILLPFVVYFLIAIADVIPYKWMIFSLVFLIGFSVETLQYFQIPVFGNTFDFWDYFMYLIGAILAWIVDVIYFSKLKRR